MMAVSQPTQANYRERDGAFQFAEKKKGTGQKYLKIVCFVKRVTEFELI